MKRKREIFTENELLERAREEMIILKSQIMNDLHYYQSIILSLQKDEAGLLANITNSVTLTHNNMHSPFFLFFFLQ